MSSISTDQINQPSTFAIITPSYAPDFERCKLLSHSISKFVSPKNVKHYIIVDRKDDALFSQLKSDNTFILTKESILPWWIKPLPLPQNIWLSLKTLPIRGWLIQQIIKIASAHHIQEDICVFVDSDVAFVRPFDLNNLINNNQVRLYRGCDGNDVQKQWHLKWHQSASKLLGLPDVNMEIPDYIDQIVSWRRDCVLQMCDHLESISGRSWIETLCNSWHLSEYVLYGIYIERILQDKSGHYYEDQNICHNYWLAESLSDRELKHFIKSIAPEQKAVMISAKAGMPVEQYYSVLEQEFAL